MMSMHYALGADIGGTHIEAVRVSAGRRVLGKARVQLPAEKGRELVASKLVECLEEVRGDGKPLAIGLAVPGIIKGGGVKASPNLPFLRSARFVPLMKRRFGAPALVENDVNCMAYGEWVRRHVSNMLAMTLGTGIGGGIIADGKLYRGRAFAGEVGHITLDFDGPKGKCGNPGCLEEYASIKSVRRLAERFLGRPMEPKEIYGLALGGNAKALSVWRAYGRMLGIGLSTLCYVLDPELIVLGGGISGAFRFFGAPMREEMRKRMFIPLPKIVTGKEGANAFGAACLALDSRQTKF